MWYIKNEQGDIIYLKPNKSMIVGRKRERDIFLDNDASISKIHATITVRPKVNFEPNEPSSTVIVEDSGSKYGTFIIDARHKARKLTPGDHELSVTDKVKFGLVHHIFTLHYVPLIISTSTLNIKEKTQLRIIIDILDGVIVDEWKEYCTHLTVSNVTLTTQVVQALAYGTSIVDLKYWDAVLNSVEINEKLPEIDNFIPAVNEGLVNRESISLRANVERKNLFKNIVFVSFSDPKCALQGIIKYAGGRLKLFTEDAFDLKQLCSDNFVLIQVASNTSLPSQASLSLYDKIQRSLQKKKLRLIPEFEIFLAILYCSREKYCNPKFDFKRLISFCGKNKDPLSDPILAEDTEVVLPTERNNPAVTIKESLTASEQIEEQESRNFNKVKLSLGKKQFADNLKDSSQSAMASKKILEKQNFGSEDSSRESALMIDETRSSVESDGNEANIKKRNFSKVFDELEDKQTIPAVQSTSRRFNLQSKLQISKSSNKDLLKKNETCINFYSNPSTSKETFHNVTEGKETLPLKRAKNISAQKSKEQNLDREIEISAVKAGLANIGEAQNLGSANDGSEISKRSRTEDDMFSPANVGSLKKIRMRDYEDDLFETLENPNIKKLHQEDNIVEKGLNQMKRYENKRRRSSLSSNEGLSSDDEQQRPKIKIEKPDSEDEIDHAPLIKCKKEFDSSMDATCKSSIVSLLRGDIAFTHNVTETNSKNFVKIYTEVPKHRIKPKNMYAWKLKDDNIIICESNDEELTSSEDDNDDFSHERNPAAKKGRGKKKVTPY